MTRHSAGTRSSRRYGLTCATFHLFIYKPGPPRFYDSIRAFADHGKNQGADVVLESWEDMNHDFQIFGHEASQSADALRRFGEVIDARARGREKKEAISC